MDKFDLDNSILSDLESVQLPSFYFLVTIEHGRYCRTEVVQLVSETTGYLQEIFQDEVHHSLIRKHPGSMSEEVDSGESFVGKA